MRKLRLIPNDVLLFRKPHPFTAGEDHLAISHSFFVPSTIAGAIRAKIFRANEDFQKNENQQLRQLIGYGKEEPQFTIVGSFPEIAGKGELFVAPNDLVEAPTSSGDIFTYARVTELAWPSVPEKLSFLQTPMKSKVPPLFLTLEGLKKYMTGMLGVQELQQDYKKHVYNLSYPKHKVHLQESRIGIKVSSSRTVEEGYLYHVQYLRLNNEASISVWIENDEKGKEAMDLLPKSGTLQLGGERRMAFYSKVEETTAITELKTTTAGLEAINQTQRFKLYLATPLINEQPMSKDAHPFDQGKQQKQKAYSWDVRKLLEESLGIQITRILPLINRLFPLSGWSLVKRNGKRIKPNRYAIPAGSVYFVNFSGEITTSQMLQLGVLKKLGFGLSILAPWEESQR